MREFTFREIEKAVGGKQIWGSPDTVVLGVSKDSREAYEGSLFFPLKGEKYDAHSFLPQVIQRGCRTFLISDEEILKALKGKENLDIIKVKDTTVALQDLAGYYLKQMSPKKNRSYRKRWQDINKGYDTLCMRQQVQDGKNKGQSE